MRYRSDPFLRWRPGGGFLTSVPVSSTNIKIRGKSNPVVKSSNVGRGGGSVTIMRHSTLLFSLELEVPDFSNITLEI